jgi:hypothetical protein
MADKINLNEREYQSIKTSFFRVFHTCLNKDMISKEVVGCLFKWAIQLHIDEREVGDLNPEQYKKNNEDRDLVLEDIFNIVYMIYLDNKVEDIELKVVSQYAQEMGFKPHLVNDLLKAIVTAPFDGYDYQDVRNQLKDILTADGNV